MKNVYVSDYNLNFLQSIDDKITITLKNNNYQFLENVCNALNKLGKTNKIIIELEEEYKSSFNKFIFSSNIKYDNIYVLANHTELKLNKYIELEKMLYKMVESAKFLSPFEKYIYAYNICKKFKAYKEDYNDPEASRNIHLILENQYIVCSGFAELLSDLLNKLGIENFSYLLEVDTSYDGEEVLEKTELKDKPTDKIGHMRVYTHIVDNKYGIDGFYFGDPTWDNDVESDYYNHLVLTNREITMSNSYNWINRYKMEELFDITSMEEFYQKLNFLIKKQGSNRETVLEHVIDKLIDIIRKLDKKYYLDFLKPKQDYLIFGDVPDEFNYEKYFEQLLNDIAYYILNNVNHEISGETIMSAVENMYRKLNIYDEDTLDSILDDIIDTNIERQNYEFPLRFKTFNNGYSEIYDNTENKFDINRNRKIV